MTTASTPTVNQSIAAELRAAAARRKKSRREIATALDVSHMWLQRRLAGDQALTVEDVVRIARVLDVDPMPMIELALAEA